MFIRLCDNYFHRALFSKAAQLTRFVRAIFVLWRGVVTFRNWFVICDLWVFGANIADWSLTMLIFKVFGFFCLFFFVLFVVSYFIFFKFSTNFCFVKFRFFHLFFQLHCHFEQIAAENNGDTLVLTILEQEKIFHKSLCDFLHRPFIIQKNNCAFQEWNSREESRENCSVILRFFASPPLLNNLFVFERKTKFVSVKLSSQQEASSISCKLHRFSSLTFKFLFCFVFCFLPSCTSHFSMGSRRLMISVIYTLCWFLVV